MDLHRAVAEELECPLCCGRYSDARLLSCNHSFCMVCLNASVKYSGQVNVLKQVECPMCRHVTLLPPGGVSVLPQDFRVNRLLQAVQDHEARIHPRLDACMTCPRESPCSPVQFCLVCRLTLCRDCAYVHRLLPASKDHEVTDVSFLINNETDIDWPDMPHRDDEEDDDVSYSGGRTMFQNLRSFRNAFVDCFAPTHSCTIL